ncbi:MAG: cupin domain-containing protein [Lentisphaerae bacterium]|nr:cupin domain-containing protein [Lentisphaerota bacterium]
MIHRPDDMQTEVRANMRGGRGSVTVRHLFQKEEITARTRLCAELVIPPGAGIGIHEHAAEDEIYIITAGSGILDDGGARTRVKAGDAVLTGNGASHAVENDGSEDLRMFAVIINY